MSDELTPEEEKALDETYQAIATMLAESKSKKSIVKELMKNDWPEETAGILVDNMEQAQRDCENSAEGKSALANKYAKHMLYGLLWAVGGGIFTAVTYDAASEGGTYFVAWGAIAFGIFDFLRGLIGWLKHRT